MSSLCIPRKIRFSANNFKFDPSKMTTTAPAIVIRRSYLIGPDNLPEFCRRFRENLVKTEREWCETYVDTKSSGLSNAECILMKDSTAPKFWKFFCYAHDNIMEITTDEKEIREPLSRLLDFESPELITEDLLQPFFEIKCWTNNYLIKGCQLHVTATDYHFAYCVLERYCLPGQEIVDIIDHLSDLATLLGLKNLAEYEADRYL